MTSEILTTALAQKQSAGNTPLDESGYLSRWQTHVESIADPALAAAAGGVHADRLAWVFVAGYQVAVRQYFGLEAEGWLAYCASEDRSGQRPGVVATETDGGWLLNGYKTWVAAVDHVARLVVSVSGSQGEYFLIDRGAEGVQLTAKPTATFLADLSQGVAQFSDVRAARRLTAATEMPFHVQEALAIYTAFCGFVMSGFGEQVAQRACTVLETSSSLWNQRMDAADIHQLQLMDREIQQLLLDVDESAGALIPGWHADRKLISMYSRGVQKLGS